MLVFFFNLYISSKLNVIKDRKIRLVFIFRLVVSCKINEKN